MRTEFNAKTKMQAFTRCGGHCEECSAKLFTGNIEYDHLIPCEMGGDASLANCSVKCRSCHKLKTTADDVPAIAKAKRRERRQVGIKRPRTMTRWRKFSGEIVVASRER
jgi:5-methylcytosine-specific restriction endonuclease McrA